MASTASQSLELCHALTPSLNQHVTTGSCLFSESLQARHAAHPLRALRRTHVPCIQTRLAAQIHQGHVGPCTCTPRDLKIQGHDISSYVCPRRIMLDPETGKGEPKACKTFGGDDLTDQIAPKNEHLNGHCRTVLMVPRAREQSTQHARSTR
jgi:hypothetical protein